MRLSNPSIDVLATWPSPETNECAQIVLEKAGRTCYQSERGPITPETSQGFCERILKRGHFSVLEHGWRGYIIYPFRNSDLGLLTKIYWPFLKFMFLTFDDNVLIISANLETWRKLYVSNKLDPEIREDLEKFCPVFFRSGPQPKLSMFNAKIVPITREDQLLRVSNKAVHIAHTVRYSGFSRGFTHELVRHRAAVYSQESTRYVDESDFVVVLPPHRDHESLESGITPLTMMETYQGFYQGLIDNNKWRREDARQFLPIGIVSQVVMSTNLEERIWIYRKRTDPAAHWEIRPAMIRDLKIFKEKYPDVFKYFSIEDNSARYDGPVEHFIYD